MIDVCKETLVQHGAVSGSVVAEIVIDTPKAAHVDYVMSIGGIARPDGGSEEKPVDTIWFAFATARGRGIIRQKRLSGGRDAVYHQATTYALQTLWQQFLQNI